MEYAILSKKLIERNRRYLEDNFQKHKEKGQEKQIMLLRLSEINMKELTIQCHMRLPSHQFMLKCITPCRIMDFCKIMNVEVE